MYWFELNFPVLLCRCGIKNNHRRQKRQALVVAALKSAGIFNIGVTKKKNISNKVMLRHQVQTNRHENQ